MSVSPACWSALVPAAPPCPFAGARCGSTAALRHGLSVLGTTVPAPAMASSCIRTHPTGRQKRASCSDFFFLFALLAALVHASTSVMHRVGASQPRAASLLGQGDRYLGRAPSTWLPEFTVTFLGCALSQRPPLKDRVTLIRYLTMRQMQTSLSGRHPLAPDGRIGDMLGPVSCRRP
jgi:hypothetical protein